MPAKAPTSYTDIPKGHNSDIEQDNHTYPDVHIVTTMPNNTSDTLQMAMVASDSRNDPSEGTIELKAIYIEPFSAGEHGPKNKWNKTIADKGVTSNIDVVVVLIHVLQSVHTRTKI